MGRFLRSGFLGLVFAIASRHCRMRSPRLRRGRRRDSAADRLAGEKFDRRGEAPGCGDDDEPAMEVGCWSQLGNRTKDNGPGDFGALGAEVMHDFRQMFVAAERSPIVHFEDPGFTATVARFNTEVENNSLELGTWAVGWVRGCLRGRRAQSGIALGGRLVPDRTSLARFWSDRGDSSCRKYTAGAEADSCRAEHSAMYAVGIGKESVSHD
jgi:hypothetical protein